MATSGARLRAAAAAIVSAVVHNGRSLDAALAYHEGGVRDDDLALLKNLAYGSLRHYFQLDEWLGELLQKPLRQKDGVVHALLAVGLYQLTATRIPDHAVVSQTVAAARQLRRPRLAGLVNACLRRFVREDMVARQPAGDAARWNHPDWLIRQLQSDWPDDWARILEANNERAPMWLRVNAKRSSVQDYLRHVDGGQTLAGLPQAVRLAAPLPVNEIPGFAAGDVSVQDGAAQVAADWLLAATGPGARILDACAAPGGKTGHLLERGANEVVALDNDAGRLRKVEQNLARLGETATIAAADASKPGEWWDGRPFDGILLDAPCSASGVIRRHPDIKLLRRAADIAALAERQIAMLSALWPLLSPGGCLLYVTCSVLAAENDDLVRRFQEAHATALENDVLPNNNIRDVMQRKACGYQILPGTAQLDGFYYACLVKTKVS